MLLKFEHFDDLFSVGLQQIFCPLSFSDFATVR